ncbi:protein kinase domain-containing protein [Citrus sinensis]|uniref:Protein kinase domain-containing protein n=1 Tax=Citrus sinensis TaxID=2711 RepID=A0ACB8LU34_CITSI|nr:protein kinase domain-containing protein [Citrus sinensis]
MKCFYIFKDKFKPKKGSNSAPEPRNQNRLDNNSALNRTARSLPSPRSIPELYKEKEHHLRVFDMQELREATNGFNRMLKIGEGGFGSVYKGTIRPLDGRGEPLVVAVKKLNNHGLQGHKQWLAEVQFLGVVSHPNLVKLLGYCSTEDERGIQRLLVYEYMPNRSLEDRLFSRAQPTLPWKTRLEIILGAAEGLAYLHEGLEIQVIYRDFKTSNVLLDGNFKPKLSDFGLAREGPTGDHTHVSTAVVGTYGYAAPEYIETGHLKSQSDIWSFGVVLYEILTGRRVLERNRPTMEQKLLEWVKQFPADGKKFSMMIDPRLRNQYSISAARRVAKLADNCLKKNPEERPTMNQVVESLKLAVQESEQGSSSTTTAAKTPVTSSSRLVDRRSKRVCINMDICDL